MNFIRHEWKMNLKSFLIWTIVVGGMIFSFLLLYKSMEEQMQSMSDAYANMGGFTQAFGMDKISVTTPLGYYGVEVGAVLALGGGMFASILGISMLAKEEGGHATEFTYVTPNSRNYFITNKLIAMVTIIAVFNIACFFLGILGFVCIDSEIEWKKIILFHIAQFLMHTEIAGICFGISAFLKKSNIGLGIGISVLLYFANIFANISTDVEKIHYITPYYYSDAVEIFSSEKLQLEYILVGMTIMLAAIIAAYVKYNRKDLSI